ncbi:MAG: hypothetical protein M1821_008597 [Bathelium mastoideum]|nr:MAG: hypothetical protein M1821_008597 [Bathelium mastoideum]KAI9687277.1 MAG: hypothetical protein M1822_002320 [Bathelium mastoideum]
MQVADILSDLTSLKVCDQSAALALVTARPDQSSPAATPSTQNGNATDPDLARAKDIVELHYSVKVAARENDLSRELEHARDQVRHALSGIA